MGTSGEHGDREQGRELLHGSVPFLWSAPVPGMKHNDLTRPSKVPGASIQRDLRGGDGCLETAPTLVLPGVGNRPASLQSPPDALWRLNGHAFVACESEIQLRAPPAFKGQTIACPLRTRSHFMGMAG